MTLEQFIKKYDGKAIDTDGAYGPQCMDLMNQYTVDVLGLPLNTLAAPTAYQSYLYSDPDFERIINSHGSAPEPGDIIYWDTRVGESGHVAVYVDGWGNKEFTSFDQNWPVGSISHLQDHDYYGVTGWLRFKNTPMTQEEKKEFELLKEQTKQNTKDIAMIKANKGSRKQLRKVRRKLGLLSPKKKKK